jgi:hypothetical protein
MGAIKLLFDQIKKHEKKCVNGYFLGSSIFRIKPGSKFSKRSTDEYSASQAIFLSYSYFSLDEPIISSKESNLKEVGAKREHIPRALMQTHFRLAPSEKRDEKQVYRLDRANKLLDREDKRMIFVPQLWVVLIGRGKLLAFQCLESSLTYSQKI